MLISLCFSGSFLTAKVLLFIAAAYKAFFSPLKDSEESDTCVLESSVDTEFNGPIIDKITGRRTRPFIIQ